MARDYFHPVVKAALIQEGWNVTDDPLEIKVGGVEVKSFLTGTSAISEFHRALGQFINYRAALED